MKKTKVNKTTREIGNILHDRVETLFEKIGFRILLSDYNLAGPDIIVDAPDIKGNTKILVQCKKTLGNLKSYGGVENLIREYADRVRDEKAAMAILVLSGFSTTNVDFDILKKKKVLIWTDDVLYGYKKLSNAIGRYAKYQLLADIGLNYKFDDPKQFDAFRITQGNAINNKAAYYVFKANPEWLLKSTAVLRRINWGSETKIRGYQRLLEQSRIVKLSNFLEKDYWALPNTLIFCTNSNLNRGVRFLNHKIKFDSKIGSLWVMDGQHRLYSFTKTSDSSRKENELICVVFDNKLLGEKSEEKQANIFIDVNINAKRVDKALLLELLNEFDLHLNRDKEKIALSIVTKLSKSRIFKNLISGYSSHGGQISLTTFVGAIQKIISIDGPLIRGRFRVDQHEKIIRFCYKELFEYFKIIQNVFNTKWGNIRYAISSDKSIRALLKLYLIVLEEHNQKNLKSYFKRLFTNLRRAGFDFKQDNYKNNYAGEGGANKLLTEWLECLGQFMPEFSKFVKEIKVAKEEDSQNEFKSTLRWNLETAGVDKNIEFSVLKTINAFLNTHGGVLYIGVNDKGEVIGLDKDYSTFKDKGRDGFRLHLENLLIERMGNDVLRLINIKFGTEKNFDFCAIKVEKNEDGASFIDKKMFYRRVFASSRLLEGQDIVKYINKTWGSNLRG